MLEIKKFPDKVLRKKSRPIEEVTAQEAALLEAMLFTMRHFSGIGLAAPQVGISQQLIVADTGEGPVRLANPQVLEIKGRETTEEGCLSVPEALVKIARPTEIIVNGLNEKSELIEVKAKGLLARVLLHEIDHLQGRLIIDYMGIVQKIKFNLRNKAKPGR